MEHADEILVGLNLLMKAAKVEKGYIEADYSLTHHRTTSQHLVVALRQTATVLNHLREWSSHTYEEVAWIFHLLTGNGGIAFEERFILHNCLINSKGSTYILN